MDPTTQTPPAAAAPPPPPPGYDASQIVPVTQPAPSNGPPPPPPGYSASDIVPSANPQNQPAKNPPSTAEQIADVAGGMGGATGAATGIVRGAAGTLSGIDRLVRKIPGVNTLLPQTEAERELQAVGEGGTSPEEQGGKFMESAAEFLLGDEALKGLSYVDKLKTVMPALKGLEKSPLLMKIVSTALRQGTVGAVQGAAKSGDLTQGLAEGAITGGSAGALEGAGGLLAKGVQRIAPTVENIGGVEHTIPADVRNAAGTPEQQAGKQSIQNAAQDTLRRNLEEVNESRAVPDSAPALPEKTGPYEFRLSGTEPVETTTGESVVPARKRQIGTAVEARPGAEDSTSPGRSVRKVPVFQYLTGVKPDVTPESVTTGGGGEMRTQDPNVAYRHLSQLNDAIDSDQFESMEPKQQQQLTSARDDMQSQIGEYRKQFQQSYPGYGQPNFEQIDIPSEVKKAQSFTDAAQNVESRASEVYNHFNDLTNDRFNALRNDNKEAWSAYIGAGTENQSSALARLNETDRQMKELMDSIHGAVTPKELSGANDAYRNSQTLHAVAQAVDGSFSGNTSSSARSWEYRGFNGQQLMGRLNKVTQRLGRPAVERVMGRENLDTLYRVAQLNQTNAGRAKFGQAVGGVTKDLLMRHASALSLGGLAAHAIGIPWEMGALSGEALYTATKKVMQIISTNPKIAQNIIFALDSGAKPENYIPLISHMIARSITPTEAGAFNSRNKDEGNQ